MDILPPRSRAGDHVDLRAEMDLIVAVSACAADVGERNGWAWPSRGPRVIA